MVGTPRRSRTWMILAATPLLFGLGLVLPAASRVSARQLADIDQPGSGDAPSEKPKLDLATATEKLIEAHNRLRKAEKLPTLAASKKLQAAAELQARDMASRSKMTHEGRDGSQVADRVKSQEYDYRRVGENIAYGRFTIDQVMEGWMKSEGHRKNILGSYSQIGAAVVLDEDGTPYWCVTFGLPRRK